MKKVNPRLKLRKFGLTVGTALLGLGAVSWYRGSVRTASILSAAGGVLLVLGLVLPQALRPIEKAWMALAMVLSWINTRIILTLLFYFVFTPVGLVMRVFRDPLNRKFREGNSTCWIRREAKAHSRTSYERLF
jgi:hypothetical protein